MAAYYNEIDPYAAQWLAKQMGDSDWTMIAKIYGKWMPEAAPDAGARAEATFAPQESCHSGAKTSQKRAKTMTR